MLVASDEATAGSVRAKQERISPASSKLTQPASSLALVRIEAALADGTLDAAFDMALPQLRGRVPHRRRERFVLTMPRRYARLLNTAYGNRILAMPMAMPAPDLYLYETMDGDAANRWLRAALLTALNKRSVDVR